MRFILVAAVASLKARRPDSRPGALVSIKNDIASSEMMRGVLS